MIKLDLIIGLYLHPRHNNKAGLLANGSLLNHKAFPAYASGT